MKKFAFVLPILALLLTGCSAGNTPMENIHDQYGKVSSAELEAEVTLHLAEENREFTLFCAYAAEGASTVTVQEPEELRGVAALVEGENLKVSYEDMILPAGTLTGVCPANVLPFLLQQLAEGYVTEWSEESRESVDCWRLTLDSEQTVCTVWLDKDSLIPRFAEISGEDGAKVLSAKMLTFRCTMTEE